jgi:organic hydroperoxide reductase OsmC/OhrA
MHLGQLADATGFGLAGELSISLPALDRHTAQTLAVKAHHDCPYSNATRGSVDIQVLETTR